MPPQQNLLAGQHQLTQGPRGAGRKRSAIRLRGLRQPPHRPASLLRVLPSNRSREGVDGVLSRCFPISSVPLRLPSASTWTNAGKQG